jgi:hypothetical protein
VEQEIINQGYVLHMPYKRKRGEHINEKEKRLSKKISPKKAMDCRTNKFMA